MLLKPHGGSEFATFRVGFKETLLSEPILTIRGDLSPLFAVFYSIGFGSLLRQIRHVVGLEEK